MRTFKLFFVFIMMLVSSLTNAQGKKVVYTIELDNITLTISKGESSTLLYVKATTTLASPIFIMKNDKRTMTIQPNDDYLSTEGRYWASYRSSFDFVIRKDSKKVAILNQQESVLIDLTTELDKARIQLSKDEAIYLQDERIRLANEQREREIRQKKEELRQARNKALIDNF